MMGIDIAVKSRCINCPFFLGENICHLPISTPRDSCTSAKEHYREYFGWKCERVFSKEQRKVLTPENSKVLKVLESSASLSHVADKYRQLLLEG